MRLPELQNSFAYGVFNAPDVRLLSFIDETYVSAADRFKAYRNNVYVGLFEALKAHFPTAVKLVGDDFFLSAVHHFVKAQPPQNALLDEYGQAFPQFLSHFQPAASVPYLADIARLDWALHEADIALDDNPLSCDALQAKQDKVADAPLPLRRSVRLLQSHYSLKDIWHFCFFADKAKPLEITKKQRHYIVYRCDDYSSWFEEINAATYVGLKSLMTGQTLLQALSAATVTDAQFDPSEFLVFSMKREIFKGE